MGRGGYSQALFWRMREKGGVSPRRLGGSDNMATGGIMGGWGGPVEVALVSAAEGASALGGSSSGGGCCCWAWEVGSGASVAGYRGGGSCSARGLTLLGGERLLVAQLGKACLGAWELQRKVSKGT